MMVRIYQDKPRERLQGRLLGVNAREEDVIDEGVYRKLTIQVESQGTKHYISAFSRDGIDIRDIPDLDSADQMAVDGYHPEVMIQYYENKGKGRDGVTRTYKNATLKDLREGFKLLE